MAEDVERTEDPTPRRRQQARKRGQIAVSREVFTVTNLLAVTLTLMALGDLPVRQALAKIPLVWHPRAELDPEAAIELLRIAFSAGIAVLIPILGMTVVAALVGGLIQTRGNIATEAAKPKASKLSPARNLSRIFKTNGPIELPKSLLKLAIVVGAVAYAIASNLEEYRGLPRLPLFPIIGFQLGIVLKALLAGALALIIVALIDYAYMFWRTEKGLKMSKSEVKDEMRQSMGDPMIRARMLSLQLERARERMIESVPKADVVVTNPEHISVALSYERDDMVAPKLVAKGGGFLAFRIREIAREAGVPIVENPPLAQALYRSVRVGDMIPVRLYEIVAEVLAYVYRLDRGRGVAW
ncbi:MAG: EscU/YscU/HrcU family type III secretion system export apparatus switch protein [Myxococcota bacterium]